MSQISLRLGVLITVLCAATGVACSGSALTREDASAQLRSSINVTRRANLDLSSQCIGDLLLRVDTQGYMEEGQVRDVEIKRSSNQFIQLSAEAEALVNAVESGLVRTTTILESPLRSSCPLTYRRVNAALTELGRQRSTAWQKTATGYTITLATRIFDEVTGIVEVNGTDGRTALADYTWHWDVTPDAELYGLTSAPQKGSARFVRYDDGWRPVVGAAQ